MGDAQVFLVRVWQHLSQFRASVRGIGQDELRLFDEPRQLGEFLRAASAAGLAPAGSEADGEDLTGSDPTRSNDREARP